MDITVIILAAGKGKRMKSALPKVMHKVGNASLLEHTLILSQKLKPKDTRVVVNEILEENQEVSELKSVYKFKSCLQPEQLGTADALKCGLAEKVSSKYVLVLYGDTPLLTYETLQRMLAASEAAAAEVMILGFYADDPTGYGRLITDAESRVIDIIEEKDASDEVKELSLCNSGIMLIETIKLTEILSQISNNNLAKEYYLTDIVKIANKQKLDCVYILGAEEEALGVNDMMQLAYVESIFQDRIREKFLKAGVSLISPETVFFSVDTEIHQESVVYPYVYFGRRVEVGSASHIHSFSHIEGTKIGEKCQIGPFARLRSGTKLDENVKIGNFVEVKNATLSRGSKASHLSYIGDASLGERCNIGAGTIFCNYNGKSKQHSKLGDEVFVGSNASIISPVTIDDYSVIGAGSVITDNVEKNELAIARAKQVNLKGKGRKRKENSS